MGNIPEFLQKEVEEYWIPGCPEPETVLDIGANVGAFSLAASRRWPRANIYAYEPMAESVEQFRKNCGNGRIHIETTAVRSYEGQGEINLCHDSLGHSFHRDRSHLGTCPVKVRDAALLPEADFIKVDTEGCETEILERLPLGKAKGLVCEYHFNEQIEPIIRICEGAGLFLVSNSRNGRSTGILKFMRTAKRPEAVKRKVFIALPIYWMVDPYFFQCVVRLTQEMTFRGLNFESAIATNAALKPAFGDSAIGRQRNALTKQFLDSDCTHLLFIDSDLVFSTDQIDRIVSHEEDIVGGVYVKKQEGKVQCVLNSIEGQEPQGTAKGLLEVKYIGTGFLRVSRRVFEAMIDAYGPEIEYKVDPVHTETQWDFWHMGVYQYKDEKDPAGKPLRRYLSEDWWFCQRARDLGFKVWADLHISVKHSGNALYPLTYQQEQLFEKEQEEKPISISSEAMTVARMEPAGEPVPTAHPATTLG